MEGPSVAPVTPLVYEFGPYRLDVATRRLLRGGVTVPLSPKAFDTLLALIEGGGRLLEKAELMQLVWKDSVVEESNLPQTIFVLRRTLGDDDDGQAFIETVPRRGYRFAAPVRVVAAPEAKAAHRPSRRRRAVVAAVAVACLLAVIGWTGLRPRRASLDPTAKKERILVLPFENLSGAGDQAYFSEGFSDEMITRLGGLDPDHLAVIARTTALQYRGARKTIRQIGDELGVDYIVEGSVMRADGRVRITAQLVRAADQSELWTEQYDRDLRDILTVQNDVADAIALQIRLRLTPEQAAHLHRSVMVNPDALEEYLKGRFFWNKRTVEGYEKAISFFEKAIALDRQGAQAYAGLADTYVLLGSTPNALIMRAEAMKRARESAQQALALDESLADAHASLAFVRMHYDWDFAGAEQEFIRAVTLNPGYATAHHWYAYDLVALGRVDQAVTEMQRAQRADPLSVIISRDLGEMLLFAGRNQEAVAECQRAIEMDRGFELAHYTLGWALERVGRSREGLDEFRQAGSSPGAELREGLVAIREGRPADTRRIVERLEREGDSRSGVWIHAAALASALHDADLAFAALERSVGEREGGLILLAVEPAWDPIRSDPRFAALMRRIGVSRPVGR